MTDTTCTIPGCTTTRIFARGWCGAHYKRWYRHGDPLADVHRRAPDGATPDERLRYVGWTEVQRREGLTPCWEWKGLTDRRAYGRVWDGQRVAAAHRLAYTAWAGPLDDDELALHACDNPPCINPEHLSPGTGADNTRDMLRRARSANGERSPHHRLTDDDVAAIRAAYTGTWGQQAELARAYGVAPSAISMIVRGLKRTEETHWEALEDDRHLVGARR